MTQTVNFDLHIDQLKTDIDDLKKTHELLSLNLPSGVTVEGGGDFYEMLRSRLANEDCKEEAQRVLAESRVQLRTKEVELAQLQSKKSRQDLTNALTPRLAELKNETEKVEAIAVQLDEACEKLARLDAAILAEFPNLSSGWGRLTMSIPIGRYRERMISITQVANGGAVIKGR